MPEWRHLLNEWHPLLLCRWLLGRPLREGGELFAAELPGADGLRPEPVHLPGEQGVQPVRHTALPEWRRVPRSAQRRLRVQMPARLDGSQLCQRCGRVHAAAEDLRQWHLQEREGLLQVLLHARIHGHSL